MNEIQLISAQNIISASKGHVIHELEFAVLVKNLAFEKHISIHWAGNDKVWHALAANYSCRSGPEQELWQARTGCRTTADQPFDTLHFSLEYFVLGSAYSDSNQNRNYCLTSSAGVLLGPGVLLTHLGYTPVFSPGKTGHPITIAVDNSLEVKQIFVRWTTDNWQTYHQSPCAPQKVEFEPCCGQE